MVEPLITLAKIDTDAKRRLAFARLRDAKVVEKLFADLGPRFKARARRLHAHSAHGSASWRYGDMALMQLVDGPAAAADAAKCAQDKEEGCQEGRRGPRQRETRPRRPAHRARRRPQRPDLWANRAGLF